jgi:hypothetical protein
MGFEHSFVAFRFVIAVRLFAAKKKAKTVPLTCRGGPYGCERSRIPHFLEYRLTDGGEVVILTCRSPFPTGTFPGTHFC